MTTKKMNKQQELQLAVEILERALKEFRLHGRVLHTKCDRCGDLIVMRSLNALSIEVCCYCGKFNDTLKGI